ncbi:hypothetical protein AGMMS4957_03850 [Bacteroidia bacterium]|nr:hypothetical protein AGMMS4957_03850 [Bacteroidia bacterium]
MKKKNFFSFCAAAALLLGTGAANAAESWNIGSPTATDVVATLDGNTLTIIGTGAMEDYSHSGGAPWSSFSTSIKTVTISEGVTSIGERAFRECRGFTSITIPNSVISIGERAFRDCSGLISVTIGTSVKSIEDDAFYGCSGLTSITIPNSVTSIEGDVFKNCSGLTSVTIGNNVTSVGNGAFGNCSNLTSVTIGNSVTSIGNAAFYGCSKLTSVTIPNSVTRIGNGAFSDCSGLTSVFCLATTPPTLILSDENENFTAVSADALYVPESALDAYNNSDWKSAFDIILAIESTTGVKTVDANKLQVYPNPTTDVFSVDNADGAEIKVYNLNGALLHRTRESRVDLSGEPSGVYLLRVGGEALKVVKK